MRHASASSHTLLSPFSSATVVTAVADADDYSRRRHRRRVGLSESLDLPSHERCQHGRRASSSGTSRPEHPATRSPNWDTDQEYAAGAQLVARRDLGVLRRRAPRRRPTGTVPAALAHQSAATTSATLVAEELVEAAETMQVRYGIDADAGWHDRFIRHRGRRRELGPSRARCAPRLVTRSPDEYGTEVDDDTYVVDETMFNPVNDRRVRQVFITTNAHSEPIAMNPTKTSVDSLARARARRGADRRAGDAARDDPARRLRPCVTRTLQERMAGNLRDSNLAFQSAERALREGEKFLRGADDTAVHGRERLAHDAGRSGPGVILERLRLGRKRQNRERAFSKWHALRCT